MQTFVPEYTYTACARVLDRQRLGKQRVEVLQILNTIAAGDNARGWRNHPAVSMWRGYELALTLYGTTICDEWVARGYTDNTAPRILAAYHACRANKPGSPAPFPEWWLDDTIHTSHRSNLIRKNPDHYAQLWDVPSDIPYVWPT